MPNSEPLSNQLNPVLDLFKTQSAALDCLEDDVHEIIVFGGGAGGGKSELLCDWEVKNCITYPGTRWLLGREELTKLKDSTLLTLLAVLKKFQLIEGKHYKLNMSNYTLRFWNESEIRMRELKHEPSDPNYDKLGSTEYTGGGIDEGQELNAKVIDVVRARFRYMLKQYKLKPKLLITCNPHEGYLKTLFYIPFINAETNKLNENNPNHVRLPELKKNEAFIVSLAKDNPNLPESYIRTLENLKDPAMRKRLLDGDWNFSQNPNQLIPSQWFYSCLRNDDFKAVGQKRLGVDLAREGDDRSFMAYWIGSHLQDIVEINIPITDEVNFGMETAKKIRHYAIQHGIGAKYVSIDGVGIGSAVFDCLLILGFRVNQYKAGEKPFTFRKDSHEFKMKRDQSYWSLREDIQAQIITINYRISNMEGFKQELFAHTYSSDDRYINVIKKAKLKLDIGKSPDIADAVVIGYLDPNLSFEEGERIVLPFVQPIKDYRHKELNKKEDEKSKAKNSAKNIQVGKNIFSIGKRK